MSEDDIDVDVRRMLFGFSAAIALLIVLFVARTIRVFIFGRRVNAVIAKVRSRQEAVRGGSRTTFAYVLRYTDSETGKRHVAHDRHWLPIREFEVGNRVTAFVAEDRRRSAEILSWLRLAASAFVFAAVCGGLIAAYHVLLRKNA